MYQAYPDPVDEVMWCKYSNIVRSDRLYNKRRAQEFIHLNKTIRLQANAHVAKSFLLKNKQKLQKQISGWTLEFLNVQKNKI